MNSPIEETAGQTGVRRARATYRDVLDAPEDKVAELIDGELVLSPRPGVQHTSVSSVLGAQLVFAFQLGQTGPGGWVIMDEPEVHFDDDILVPDLAGWRKERAQPVDRSAFFRISPDWVCEILSPSTEARDRAEKLDIYARARVRYVWLLDPELKTLEVYSLSDLGYVVAKTWHGAAKVRAVPFDAIELDLASLWPIS